MRLAYAIAVIGENSGERESVKQAEAQALLVQRALERQRRKAKRESEKKQRRRRPVTQACFDMQCKSVVLKDRQDGRLGCKSTCSRIKCPLEEEDGPN